MKKAFIYCWAIAMFCATGLFAQEANSLRKAPELAFQIPGQGQKLLSQLRGKVVVIDFILTTCPHCQAAAQMLTRLQAEYGPRGFQALDLAINGLDEGRTPQQADSLASMFQAMYRVGFPVGWIPRDQFMSFMGFSLAEYMVVPQVVVIDRKGMIHYQTAARGEDKLREEGTLRQHIEELLALHDTASTKTHVAKR